MTNELRVQEEPAIYKVLTQRPPVVNRSLRSLGTWSGGGTPSKAVAAFWTGGTIPWVSPKDMKVARIRDAEDRITADAVASSATSLVKAGAVVLVVRSGILKHSLPVAVTDVDVALNQDMKALQPGAGVGVDYVAWALRANTERILHTCTKAGTTVQSIEMPALLDFEIPLPTPEEQQRVVETVEARLSLLDASVAGLLRVRANLKRYRASVLKSACEGRLVPTEAELARQEGRDFETGAQLLQRVLAERQKLPQSKPKTKELSAPAVDGLPALPEGWCWSTLESISSVTGGLAKSSSRVANSPMREVPYLRVANVQRGYLELSEIKTILATEKDIAGLRLMPGDVLFNEGGDRDKLGRGHVWNGEVPEAIHQNHVFRARASRHHALPQYLSMCGNGYGGDWFSEFASQSVNLASISLSTLRKFPVALPPLAEQHRIVAEADRRLSLIRAAEVQVVANLARAQRLRQSSGDFHNARFSGTIEA
jgi:type I restriction enzyme S subunit